MSELFSKSKDNQVQQNGLIMSIDEVIDYLNTSNNAIGSLQYENAKLRKQVESSETTSDATSNYNAFLESKITTLEEENERLKKKLESLQKVLHLVECVSDE